MKIIHIGGSPGAGKSTLGKKLKNKLSSIKLMVIDFDHWIGDTTSIFLKEIKQMHSENDYASFNKNIYKLFNTGFKKFISSIKNKYDLLIITRLKEPDPWIELGKGKYAEVDPYEIKLPTSTKKLYIQINIPELKRRVIKRDGSLYPNLEKTKKMFDKKYNKEGYEFLTNDEIYKKVIEMVMI
jgi:thymidylate kinase